MNHITNSMLVKIPYSTILHAIEKTDSDPFTMEIRSQSEWHVIAYCVNQGIDSHLEAITDSVFDNGHCEVSPQSFCVLLRRLGEYDEDGYTEDKEDTDEDYWDIATNLQSSILTVLGIDDYGKYVGRKAMGLE